MLDPFLAEGIQALPMFHAMVGSANVRTALCKNLMPRFRQNTTNAQK